MRGAAVRPTAAKAAWGAASGGRSRRGIMTGLTRGTLKRLPVRDVFKDEAGDFTPWLALPDNLAKIGNIIGLDLELVGTEYAVGPFAADILCKATPGDGYVIIENQTCLLYTSDAADDLLCVDLGGRRI